jgi:hypothetical protein
MGAPGTRRRIEMKAQRFGMTLIAVASIATVVGVGVGATGGTPPWLEALNARSQALNDKHGLGVERRVLGAPGPGWEKALHARSDALNRQYGLGQYARQGARTTGAPEWLSALNARSDALNRQYGLGDYATKG